MTEKLPEGKFKRSVVTGKTAVAIGGNVVRYLSKKPFLSSDKQQTEKKKLDEINAKTIFKGLVLLKGTALKIAQALSLESGIIPDEIRAELEKSYNQVPPMNRVLVRRALKTAFQQDPETVFQTIDMNAFAAASLGQVHRAVSKNGDELAVKIQYPGISETIKSDLQMVKGLLKPLKEYQLILPSLLEIEKRLNEEVDYVKEAENMKSFQAFLKEKDVSLPAYHPEYSSKTVLTTQFVKGKTIDGWLKEGPDQNDCDAFANSLYRLFIDGFYGYGFIHADPNPGNYIITDENKLCLVDFGCVKHFSKNFVDDHRELIQTILQKESRKYLTVLQKLSVVSEKLSKKEKETLAPLISDVMAWYSQLYKDPVFDFGKNRAFLKEGRELMMGLFNHRKSFSPNAEFVFLDRTRYGLFRLFEIMSARVEMNNPYETVTSYPY